MLSKNDRRLASMPVLVYHLIPWFIKILIWHWMARLDISIVVVSPSLSLSFSLSLPSTSAKTMQTGRDKIGKNWILAKCKKLNLHLQKGFASAKCDGVCANHTPLCKNGQILARRGKFWPKLNIFWPVLRFKAKFCKRGCIWSAPPMHPRWRKNQHISLTLSLSHSLSLSLSLSPSSLSHSLSLCLFNVVLLVMSLLFAFECPTIFFSLSQFLLTLFRSILSRNFSLSMCEWVRESLLYTSCLFSPKSSLLPSQRCWVGPATTPPNFFPTTKKFRKRSVQRPSNADANANDVAHFWRMRIGEKVISIRSRPVQPQRRPTSVMTLYRIQRHKERFSIERENHSKQICQWFVDLSLSLSLIWTPSIYQVS